MDKKAEGSYFLLVAMVAIVAVAGIVVMMLGVKAPAADTAGKASVAARNLAGEATNTGDQITAQKMLNILNRCIVVNVGAPPSGTVQTCTSVCSQFQKTCISGFIGFDNPEGSWDSNTVSRPIPCNDATNNYPTAAGSKCTCCSP